MLIFTDIDGTLFDNEHRSELVPADPIRVENWDEFNAAHINDEPVRHIMQFLSMLSRDNMVVYLTSRSARFEMSTREQLRAFGLPYGPLSMRPIDDHRPSAEVKLSHIADWLRLQCVDDGAFTTIDDDPSVCAAVRAAYPDAHVIEVPSADCSVRKEQLSC